MRLLFSGKFPEETIFFWQGKVKDP